MNHAKSNQKKQTAQKKPGKAKKMIRRTVARQGIRHGRKIVLERKF